MKTNVMGSINVTRCVILIGLAKAGVFLAVSNNLGISLQSLICYDFEFCRDSCKTLNLRSQGRIRQIFRMISEDNRTSFNLLVRFSDLFFPAYTVTDIGRHSMQCTPGATVKDILSPTWKCNKLKSLVVPLHLPPDL